METSSPSDDRAHGELEAVVYNRHRPHIAVGGRTPEEAWTGVALPEPIRFRQRDPLKPTIRVHRRHCRGDPLLPVIEISVRKAA